MREVLREYSKAIIAILVAILILGMYTGGKYAIRTFKKAEEENKFIDLNEFQYSTYISNTIVLGIYEIPVVSKSSSDIVLRNEIKPDNIYKDIDQKIEAEGREKTVYYKASDIISAKTTNNEKITEIRIIENEYFAEGIKKGQVINPKYFINGEEKSKQEVLQYVNKENSKAGYAKYNISDYEYYTFNNPGIYSISIRINAEGMYSTRIFSLNIK